MSDAPYEPMPEAQGAAAGWEGKPLASWGKQMLGIRVVRDSGDPFDFGTAMLRELVIKGLLFGVVGGWFLAIPTVLDFLWPLWDDENRCLHDFVVSTHVVES